MERDSDRQKEMEGHRSTGQGSQRAVVPMEEEEDELLYSLLIEVLVLCYEALLSQLFPPPSSLVAAKIFALVLELTVIADQRILML